MFSWCCCGGSDDDFIGDMYSPLLDDSKPKKKSTSNNNNRPSAFDDANSKADKALSSRPKRQPFARINRTPNTKKLINGINNVLVNTLPELQRLFPCDSEEQLEDTLSDLISIMLEVISRQDTTMAFLYRLECLRQASPREHQLDDENEDGENEEGGGLLTDPSLISGIRDVELQRTVGGTIVSPTTSSGDGGSGEKAIRVNMVVARAWVDALYAYVSTSGTNHTSKGKKSSSSPKAKGSPSSTTGESSSNLPSTRGIEAPQRWLEHIHHNTLAQCAVGAYRPFNVVSMDRDSGGGGGTSSPLSRAIGASSSPSSPIGGGGGAPHTVAHANAVPPCVFYCEMNLFVDLLTSSSSTASSSKIDAGSPAAGGASSGAGGGGGTSSKHEAAMAEATTINDELMSSALPTRTFTKAIGKSTGELPVLLAMWFDADVDCSGSVSILELRVLLSRLNVSLSKRALDELVAKVDTSKNALIEFSEFIIMYQLLTTSTDIGILFELNASNINATTSSSSAKRKKSLFGSSVALSPQRSGSASSSSTSRRDGNGHPMQSALSCAGFSSKTYSNTTGRRMGMTRQDLIRFLVDVQGEYQLDKPENSFELELHLVAHGLGTAEASPINNNHTSATFSGSSRRHSAAFGDFVEEDGIDEDEPYSHQRQFQRALLNPLINGWIHPRESAVHHDMHQPLTHYFIDSSHNTYLSGHQLHGSSTADMYRRALLSGSRCLELDCYDGPSGDPVITHGGTLTSKVRFRDVIHTINRYAFVTSPYPVTLSLENHTSLPQQVTMVNIMKEIFGVKMTNATMAESSSLTGYEFTPEGLKYKIIIKTKRARSNNSNLQGALLREEAEGRAAQAQKGTGGGGGDADDVDDSPAFETSKDSVFLDSKSISKELSEATYMAGVKFKSFSHCAVLPHYAISSIDEGKILGWATALSNAVVACGPYKGSTTLSPGISSRFAGGGGEKSEEDVKRSAAAAAMAAAAKPIGLGMRFFLRVYPKGSRMDSSNMDPFPGWNIGSQMCAMNIQTLDEGNRLSRFKFRQNGRCGYILKPLAMRRDGGMSLGFRDNAKLTVRIVCGISLPRPDKKTSGDIVDPYVEVFIRGWGQDDSTAVSTVNPRRCTPVVDDNGFNPRWDALDDMEDLQLDAIATENKNRAVAAASSKSKKNSSTFDFTIQAIELGMLCVRVFDKDVMGADGFVGENCATLSTLRQGFRCVPLFDKNGILLPQPTCLFIHLCWNGVDTHSLLTSSINSTPPQRRVPNTLFGIPTTSNPYHNNSNNNNNNPASPSSPEGSYIPVSLGGSSNAGMDNSSMTSLNNKVQGIFPSGGDNHSNSSGDAGSFTSADFMLGQSGLTENGGGTTPSIRRVTPQKPLRTTMMGNTPSPSPRDGGGGGGGSDNNNSLDEDDRQSSTFSGTGGSQSRFLKRRGMVSGGSSLDSLGSHPGHSGGGKAAAAASPSSASPARELNLDDL